MAQLQFASNSPLLQPIETVLLDKEHYTQAPWLAVPGVVLCSLVSSFLLMGCGCGLGVAHLNFLHQRRLAQLPGLGQCWFGRRALEAVLPLVTSALLHCLQHEHFGSP